MLGRMRSTELTDEQWENLAPLLPPRRSRGRPRADDRKTLNGILYVLGRIHLPVPEATLRVDALQSHRKAMATGVEARGGGT